MSGHEELIARPFARHFNNVMHSMGRYPVDIKCRGRQMAYEMQNKTLVMDVSRGVSVYSHKETRAFPIKFALAELAWILAMRQDVASIAKFNKNIVHYSDDTLVMGGAYGKRLGTQVHSAIDRILEDKHTRQACMSIWYPTDASSTSKDHPCNVMLQFMVRDDELNLTVMARSSDFITGLPIDAFHWQFLLCLVRNQLRAYYPELRVGAVTYHMTSLHVYDVDNEAFKSMREYSAANWHMKASHYIAVPDSATYSSVMLNCMKRFDSCASLDDLVSLFILYPHEKDNIYALHETFKCRTNKFVRKGDKA